jgi:hypothetical protein
MMILLALLSLRHLQPARRPHRPGKEGSQMFAIIAAIIFAFALILDWADATLGDAFTPTTLLTAGLLCVALHLAGVGTTWRTGRRRRR